MSSFAFRADPTSVLSLMRVGSLPEGVVQQRAEHTPLSGPSAVPALQHGAPGRPIKALTSRLADCPRRCHCRSERFTRSAEAPNVTGQYHPDATKRSVDRYGDARSTVRPWTFDLRAISDHDLAAVRSHTDVARTRCAVGRKKCSDLLCTEMSSPAALPWASALGSGRSSSAPALQSLLGFAALDTRTCQARR
jgi:hypothetical protein